MLVFGLFVMLSLIIIFVCTVHTVLISDLAPWVIFLKYNMHIAYTPYHNC